MELEWGGKKLASAALNLTLNCSCSSHCHLPLQPLPLTYHPHCIPASAPLPTPSSPPLVPSHHCCLFVIAPTLALLQPMAWSTWVLCPLPSLAAAVMPSAVLVQVGARVTTCFMPWCSVGLEPELWRVSGSVRGRRGRLWGRNQK